MKADDIAGTLDGLKRVLTLSPEWFNRAPKMPPEHERTRLIGDIARVIHEESMTSEARAAALTFIGWLARRLPEECPCQKGVAIMKRRAAKASVRAPRKSRS